jgi:hypothetical protein
VKKRVIEIVSALFVFALGIVLPGQLTAHALELVGVPSGMLMATALVNFASIDGQSYQQGNPGGLRRVLILLARKIKNPWPTEALIDAQGNVTALPEYTDAGTKWAEYMFPDGTASVDSDGGGDPGYQSNKHMVELALAGFSAEIRAEIKKHQNAGSIVIVEMKDGQYQVAGSSDDPIFLKPSYKGGKKGNDKRGYTLKGDVDGMMWDLPVLKPNLVASLPISPIVAAASSVPAGQ